MRFLAFSHLQTMSTLATRVSIPEKVLCRDLGAEAVVLDLESGTYYGLDEMGLRMWTLLQSHGDVRSVHKALLEEYEVSCERLRQDLLDFVDLLASRKLVEIQDA